MDGKSIVADYSLDVPWGVEGQRASIDKVLDEYMTKDEERERKRRERMLQAQRMLASSHHSSAPRGRNHVFGIHADGTAVDDTQDGAMADGLSLAMGSAAHRVYVQNRQGMDSFERERADMARIGFGTKGDQEAPGADEFHDERYEELSHQDDETAESNELQLSKDDSAVAARMEGHVIKEEQAERIMRMAQARADRSATLADDAFAESHLPRILDHAVHDMTKRTLDEDVAATERVMDAIANMEAELGS